MTQTITYRGKSATVEDVARTLIIAASIHPGNEPFQFPMTREAAMHLGRALEIAIAIDKGRDAHCDKMQAILDGAKADYIRSDELLKQAKATNTQAICTLAAALVFFTAGAVVWWMA